MLSEGNDCTVSDPMGHTGITIWKYFSDKEKGRVISKIYLLVHIGLELNSKNPLPSVHNVESL
jgi:hypothetical protein